MDACAWLLELLRELVTNAAEAKHDGGVVIVLATATPVLEVDVANFAPSLPPAVLAEPLTVPGQARGGHDGLGLGIAHRLSQALPAQLLLRHDAETGWFHATVIGRPTATP